MILLGMLSRRSLTSTSKLDQTFDYSKNQIGGKRMKIDMKNKKQAINSNIWKDLFIPIIIRTRIITCHHAPFQEQPEPHLCPVRHIIYHHVNVLSYSYIKSIKPPSIPSTKMSRATREINYQNRSLSQMYMHVVRKCVAHRGIVLS